MQREIKFRAWDGKKMHYEGVVVYLGEAWLEKASFETDKILLEGDNPYTPLQFIGLKDKSGTEIYEGDILKLGGDKIVYIEPVVLETDGYKGDRWSYGYPDKHNFPVNSWGEVIGNIYENPELLK